MKSCDELVVNVRGDTRNEDAPTSASRLGIPSSDFVRYLNYAQERCQSLVLKTNPGAFRSEYITNTIAGTEAYTVPDRVFSGERIINVQYSLDGTDRAYTDLPERALNNRNTNSYFLPAFYIRRSSSVLINPIPSSSASKLRIAYERQVDSLALRNGLIGSTGASTIVLTAPTTEQQALLTTNTYICISKFDGTVLLRNALISTFTAGTTITVVGTVTSYLVTGFVAADLVGAYVTVGRYTTTHSTLSDICERYLEVYCGMKIFMRDSGNDVTESKAELEMLEQDIVQTYQDSYRDEMSIQIDNSSMILRDDWGL